MALFKKIVQLKTYMKSIDYISTIDAESVCFYIEPSSSIANWIHFWQRIFYENPSNFIFFGLIQSIFFLFFPLYIFFLIYLLFDILILFSFQKFCSIWRRYYTLDEHFIVSIETILFTLTDYFVGALYSNYPDTFSSWFWFQFCQW